MANRPVCERRQKILAFVRAYTREHSVAPTIREIMAACAVSSTSMVEYHLTALEKAGDLAPRPHGQARAARPMGSRLVAPGDMVTVVVDGRLVQAPIVVEEGVVRVRGKETLDYRTSVLVQWIRRAFSPEAAEARVRKHPGPRADGKAE